MISSPFLGLLNVIHQGRYLAEQDSSKMIIRNIVHLCLYIPISGDTALRYDDLIVSYVQDIDSELVHLCLHVIISREIGVWGIIGSNQRECPRYKFRTLYHVHLCLYMLITEDESQRYDCIWSKSMIYTFTYLSLTAHEMRLNLIVECGQNTDSENCKSRPLLNNLWSCSSQIWFDLIIEYGQYTKVDHCTAIPLRSYLWSCSFQIYFDLNIQKIVHLYILHLLLVLPYIYNFVKILSSNE